MPTETLGFTTREARDAEYRRLKSEDMRGLGRHTTHLKQLVRRMVDGQEKEMEILDPRITYVVTWTEPVKTAVEEKT